MRRTKDLTNEDIEQIKDILNFSNDVNYRRVFIGEQDQEQYSIINYDYMVCHGLMKKFRQSGFLIYLITTKDIWIFKPSEVS